MNIQRVIDWNAARYEQQHDDALTENLLEEEITEFVLAQTQVDRVDALLDTIYIAIGALWKMGFDADGIEEAFNIVCDSNDTKTVEKTPSFIKANMTKGKNFVPPEPKLKELMRRQNVR